MKRFLAFFSCSFVVFSNPVISDGIVLDGSTTPTGTAETLSPDASGTIQIDAALGTGSGTNLFHSFDDFNVNSNENAVFTDTASTSARYENVIARVTGPNDSVINGGISTGTGLEGANLFLINPNGVMFGSGASVNVQGAFYVSTADLLYFENQDQPLEMNISDKSHFSSAPVSAFGFTDVLADTSVTFQDSTISTTAADIGIFADNIELTHSTIASNNGQITLATAAGNSSIHLNAVELPIPEAGNITLTNNATVIESGDSNIVIRGGNLTLSGNSQITQTAQNSSNSPPTLDIKLSGELLLETSQLLATSNSGDAGDIHIEADSVELTSGSTIKNSAPNAPPFPAPPAVNAGNITISANTLSITGQSFDEAASNGSRTPIETGIISQGNANSTSGGDIEIFAENVSLSQNAIIRTKGHGNAPGGIFLSDKTGSGSLSMTSGAQIYLNNDSAENCKPLTLSFGTIDISGTDIYTGSDQAYVNSPRRSGIRIRNNQSTQGSELIINSDIFRLSQSAQIITFSATDLSGGNVTINSHDVTISGIDNSFLNTPEESEGGANITAYHSGDLSTYTGTSGANININATRIEVSDSGYLKVYSNYNGATFTDPGSISIHGRDILFDRQAQIISESSDISEVAPIGNITITADNSLYINSSLITTRRDLIMGSGGNIKIDSNNIAVINSQINSSATGGNGGDIDIQANFGFITSDSEINATSEKRISGNITISSNLNHQAHDNLSIQPHTENDIRLTDKCTSRFEKNSLLIIKDTQPLGYHGDYEHGSSPISLFNTSKHNNVVDCIKQLAFLN